MGAMNLRYGIGAPHPWLRQINNLVNTVKLNGVNAKEPLLLILPTPEVESDRFLHCYWLQLLLHIERTPLLGIPAIRCNDPLHKRASNSPDHPLWPERAGMIVMPD